MSELAYDTTGDRFEVAADAAGWRGRRFRHAGARGALNKGFTALHGQARHAFTAMWTSASARRQVDPVDQVLDLMVARLRAMTPGDATAALSCLAFPRVAAPRIAP